MIYELWRDPFLHFKILVKSFGTENRKVTNKVPARNEIYEYIVFRGSDIDDLHVAAGPNENKQGQVGEDPAIVQVLLEIMMLYLCIFVGQDLHKH